MNERELSEILRGESNSVEWKRGGDPEKIVETLAAFANDYEDVGGGRVVCGIEESKQEDGSSTPNPIGVTSGDARRLRDRIFELTKSYVVPAIAPRFESHSLAEGKELLVVRIATSTEIHTFRKAVVVRLGDKVTDATTGQIAELAQRKAHLDWLVQPCPGATLADIDYFALEEIAKSAGPGEASRFLEPGFRMFGSAPSFTSGIPGPDGPTTVPNRFTMLLIGNNPQHFMPGAFVKLTRFGGTARVTDEFTSNEFFGPIPRLVSQVRGILDAEASVITDKTLDFSNGGQNRIRYSRQALHEFLVNALAHRDYRDHLSTKIYVYQDRIEFESPGGLEGLATKRGETRWRNPSLALHLSRLGLAQETGSGIPKAIHETIAASGKEPIFEVGDWFKVTVPAYQSPSHKHTEDAAVSPEAGVLLISIGFGTIDPNLVRRSHAEFRDISEDKICSYHHSGLVAWDQWPELIRELRNWLRTAWRTVDFKSSTCSIADR